MKALFLSVAFLTFLLLSIPVLAQTPSEEGESVKISTNLIQFDVTVTDKDGNPVIDLKPSDLETYENGKKADKNQIASQSIDFEVTE